MKSIPLFLVSCFAMLMCSCESPQTVVVVRRHHSSSGGNYGNCGSGGNYGNVRNVGTARCRSGTVSLVTRRPVPGMSGVVEARRDGRTSLESASAADFAWHITHPDNLKGGGDVYYIGAPGTAGH